MGSSSISTSGKSPSITELKEILRRLQLTTPTAQDASGDLAKLLVYSRQPDVVRQYFTADVVYLLFEHGYRRQNSNDALRCLANALFLVEGHRQVLVDRASAIDIAESLSHQPSVDQEFLTCRILFLFTYGTNLDFEQLDRNTDLCDNIVQLCEHHAESCADDQVMVSQEIQALDELLKLLFNVVHFFPSLVKKFEPAIDPLARLLLAYPVQSPPLQPPIASLINALLNVDIEAAARTLDEEGRSIGEVVAQLLSIFERAVKEYDHKALDSAANPLCTLLRKICDVGDTTIRTQLRLSLLPQDHERDKPLGEGDSLAAHLLRLSTSADLPNLGQNISNLLFELSDKDAEKFVHNVGYGYASGYLLSHGMTAPVPNNSTEPVGSTEAINPVTGQHLASESVDQTALSEMTDEEKEREAERLFVLFERLKATGVVDVKNPVERLYRDSG